ncbi:class III cytochrome C family protein [Desulfobotulus alkaliphilus]|uniref:Class III cytochrome C family protein n=1 Tax=Desulfobotulus alkaliphilus TaxID=622671 RepID=A0A562R876_9BACT|nr:cytochrome c3 family protein [Desulfobotulus alkaliphilus]TWI64620.1 class III cytochrome C family protein [Desulfobotulus alkaliphilus]
MQHLPPKKLLAVAIVLSLLGFGAYTLFPAQPPMEPVRILFEGKAGNVLFDHQIHAENYGLDCASCHHNLEYGDDTFSCLACHEKDSDDPFMLSYMDALHDQCIQCHEDEQAGPVDCAACHNR